MKRLSYILISIACMLLLISCSVFKKKEKREEYQQQYKQSQAASFREAVAIDYSFYGGEGLSGFLPFELLRDPRFEELPGQPNRYRPITVESGDMLLEFVQSDSGFRYTAQPKKTASGTVRFESEKQAKTESEEQMDFAEWYEFTKEVSRVPRWIWLIIALLILLYAVWRIVRPKIRF